MVQHTKPKKNSERPRTVFDYLRDGRVLQALAQIVFIILVVMALSLVWSSILNSLNEKDLLPSFGFLSTRSGIPITETPDWYTTDSSYGQAFLVGMINTIRAVSVGLVGTTIIGILFGILLLSKNWLVRTIARTYVEIIRNTPLLVQLVFWYALLLSLPTSFVNFPAEGISNIPYRIPIYLIVFLTIWLISRSLALPRMTMAAILSIVGMEIVFAAFGFNVASSGFVLVIGLIVVVIAVFLPANYRNILQSAAIVPIVQFVSHAGLYIVYEMGLVSDPMAYRSEVFPAIIFNNRGMVLPELLGTPRFGSWGAFLAVGIALAIIIWMYSGHVIETTGKPIRRGWYGILSIVGFGIMGLFIVGAELPPTTIPQSVDGEIQYVEVEKLREERPLTIAEQREVSTAPVIIALPDKPRFRYETGVVISPEYLALLIGLIVNTSATIAEIVRAGIQAVSYGQVEAARALGLSSGQTMRLIVLPQALRVIIPPLTNQYLNLSKNSSLATIVAFGDTYAIGVTMMNQSGQSITGFAMLLLVYLSLSLIISLVMNIINSRFNLVTR
jgi:general L-amino acid transport system permease protein